MHTQTLLTRLFFGAAFALMTGAGLLLPTHRAAAQDEYAPAEEGDQIIIIVDRCPGRTMPVCRTVTSGGVSDFYYFP